MGKVATGFSTSLDRFIARPNGDVGPLFDWYFAGDAEYTVPGGHFTLRVSAQSAELLSESYESMGALVVGHRHFDHARGWGGRHPMRVPVFVVTHTVPGNGPTKAHLSPSLRTASSAVEQAKGVAGSKGVGVGGAEVAQQCIGAGLIDEVGIDLVPALLGEGVRFLDRLSTGPIEWERTMVIEAPRFTHLRFLVVKVGGVT